MTVLVTGANGHIGGNLVRALLARGTQVRALVHHSTKALEGLRIELVPGDVSNAESLSAAMANIDIVFHLAGIISIDGPKGGLVNRVNVEGVRNVAEAALEAGVRRLVHFSSIHAFAQAPLDRPIDESRARVSGPRHSSYDLSKAAGERAIADAVEKGLDAVIVNPADVIGPNDLAPSRMGRVLIQLYERRIAGLVTGGFNWVDVRDVVEGALAAAERGQTGHNYLLAGHALSIRDIAMLCAEITGVPAPRFSSPMWLARTIAPLALMSSRAMRRSPSLTPESLATLRGNPDVRSDKAHRELAYSPRPIIDTLEATYHWFAGARMLRPNQNLQAPTALRP